MEYFLIITFMINGNVMFNTNLLPQHFETYEECTSELQVAKDFMDNNSPHPYHLGCYKLEPEGDTT